MANQRAVGDLAVGDIFHAVSPNGASLICLAILVNEMKIRARTVTTQLYLDFDRETGVAELGVEPILCIIDSVFPLPVDIHNMMLEIDRKFRMERNLDKLKLNENEQGALLYVDNHFSSNKL